MQSMKINLPPKSRRLDRHPAVIGRVSARGLVGGLQTVKTGRKEPDSDLAHDIVERCFRKGLLMFAPVGAWGQTVKIGPPLTIPQEALEEGLTVLGEAVDEAVAAARETNHVSSDFSQTPSIPVVRKQSGAAPSVSPANISV